VFLFTLSLLPGQSSAYRGQIRGSVLDPQGSAVPAAKVRITHTATGAARESAADPQGRILAMSLPSGAYEVVVQKDGFADTRLEGVMVHVGATTTLAIVLRLGATAQALDVQAPLIDVEMAAPAALVGAKAVDNLPINGRRFQDFALLTPTVQTDPERGQLSFAGQRGVNSNVMLDGSDYNNPFFGGIRGGERSNFILTVPQSAVEEFQVVVSGYTAEYGRSTGGVLNAITKSGTNKWHGTAFYQMRHKETGRRNAFDRKILETQQQLGGGAGGALRADRLFVFSAYEQQNAKTPREIFFGALSGRTPTPNSAEALAYFQSLEGPFQSTNNGLATLHRLDWLRSAGSRLTARYNISNANARNAASVGGTAETLTTSALTNNGDERDRTHSGLAQWTSVLSPTAVNDLRLSVTHELRPRSSNSTVPGVTSTIGQFGARNFLPTTQNDSRFQFSDGLSLLRGGHNFKFGADYNLLRTYQRFGQNQFGFFTFNTANVGDILDILSTGGTLPNRFDSNAVSYQIQIGNMEAGLRMHQIALFAQDSFRIGSRLTLDYGLRWEGQKNPTPEANNPALLGAFDGVSLPIGLALDPRRIPSAMRQWMPRAGFSLRPFGGERTIIRGHAGVFYAATPMLLFTDPMSNFRLPPGNVSISLPLPGSTVYRDMLSAGINLNQFSLGALPVLTAEQILRVNGGRNPYANARVTAMASDFANPRSFQIGLGADQQIGSRFRAGLQLNLINTVQLQRNRDYNLPAPRLLPNDRSLRPNFGLTAAGAARVLRPISSLDRVTVRESNARSLYKGATSVLAYRSRRWQMQAYYTWSQTFSDDDNERSSTGLLYDNAFDLEQEYGYSRLDARHQFTGNALYTFFWGVDLSATFRYRSALPIDPLAGIDLNQDGNNSERALMAPGILFGRNSFRNRDFRNVDFRILKGFRAGEGRTLELSAELFNAFDFPNVAYAGRNLNRGPGIDPGTGAVIAPLLTFQRLRVPDGSYDPVNTQVGGPMQAQLGLRFRF
jgi:hypothetical protein